MSGCCLEDCILLLKKLSKFHIDPACPLCQLQHSYTLHYTTTFTYTLSQHSYILSLYERVEMNPRNTCADICNISTCLAILMKRKSRPNLEKRN